MKIDENKEWTESGLKTETEYVLSQKEWDELQSRIKKLEAHIRVLLDNDPDDPVVGLTENGGCPVIDLWRHVAKDLLKGADNDG